MRALDAGCGEGYLSRILASNGAIVTGLDSSARLIEAARAKNLIDALPITFDVSSVNDLPYPADLFDLVVCNHLLNDLYDPSRPISEFARVLRSGGRLIILMLHPCFYNKHAERAHATNSLIAASYFETRNIEQVFEVDGLTSPVPNTTWFRPLEFYTEELRKSGFAITSLTEPHPSAEQVRSDAWWRKGFTRPLFILLAAQKLVSHQDRGALRPDHLHDQALCEPEGRGDRSITHIMPLSGRVYARMGWCSASMISSSFDRRSALPARPAGTATWKG